MRKIGIFGVFAVLLLTIAIAGCSRPRPVYVEPPPPSAELNEIARQGYHDGVEAARRDVDARRSPNPERNPRFRKPPVPPAAWEDYRHGFRTGYDRAYRHS